MNLRTIRYALWGLVVVAVAGVAGVWIGHRAIEPESGIIGVASIGGPFELVGTDGERVSSQTLFQKPTALFFGFTHCPEICPTTLFEAGGWLEALGEDADNLNVVFVSVDPERDTPEVLATYMSAFDPRLIGLTGSPEEVAEVVKDYRIYAQKVELDGGGYTVDHYAAVLLFDETGGFRGSVDISDSKDDVVAKLKRLVEAG
jgi:protein SCO1/2